MGLRLGPYQSPSGGQFFYERDTPVLGGGAKFIKLTPQKSIRPVLGAVWLSHTGSIHRFLSFGRSEARTGNWAEGRSGGTAEGRLLVTISQGRAPSLVQRDFRRRRFGTWGA